jgi:hypothetical protein
MRWCKLLLEMCLFVLCTSRSRGQAPKFDLQPKLYFHVGLLRSRKAGLLNL